MVNMVGRGFVILILLKVSIAQSAPHSSYPDEDEEALIDKLASLAAAVGPEAFLSRQTNPQYLPQNNYDLAGYLAAGASGPADSASDWAAEDALIAREAALKLPRQFGYKPTDPRFNLPAELFPPREEIVQPQAPQEEHETPQETLPNIPPRGQSEVILGDDKSDFYFMKRKEQQASGLSRSVIPEPSNIVASENSANHPGYSSQAVEKPFTYADVYYIAIVAGCSAAAVVGIIAAGICWYRVHERIKAAADVDYPAYGVTGPSKDITPSGGGDRKLAQSAQMYHYQHQKQQMAALQKGAIQGDRQGSGGSDVESDDDNEDGDYTVYECPGLAPAGEMEVKNPLFNDDQQTPATPAVKTGSRDDSSAPDDTASSTSSASSTATITSSTPKISESPKTPPADAPPKGKGKEKK